MANFLRLRWVFLALLIGPGLFFAPGEAVAKKESPERVFCSRQNVEAFRQANNTSVDKTTGQAFKRVVDLEAFYTAAKKNNTLRRYAQSQEPYPGTDAILNLWNNKYHLNDHRMLAYILASVWHETGRRMYPVREAFGKSDQATINALNRCCRGRKGFAYYWYIVKETGKAYFGRGHIQLTWDYNYKKADSLLGWNKEDGTSIYWNPDLALDSDRSAEITFDGMMYGWYRPGYCLPKFFKQNRAPNWNGARDIVNADYRKNGALIGNYAKAFNAVLESPGVITTATALMKKQERAEELAKKTEEEEKKQAEEAAAKAKELAALNAKQREEKLAADMAAAEKAKAEAEKKAAQEAQREVDQQAREVARQRARDDARRRIQKVEKDVLALDQRLEALDEGQAGAAETLQDQGGQIALQAESLERLSDEMQSLNDRQASMDSKLDAILAAMKAQASNEATIDTLQRKVDALEQCGFWDHLFGCETGE